MRSFHHIGIDVHSLRLILVRQAGGNLQERVRMIARQVRLIIDMLHILYDLIQDDSFTCHDSIDDTAKLILDVRPLSRDNQPAARFQTIVQFG